MEAKNKSNKLNNILLSTTLLLSISTIKAQNLPQIAITQIIDHPSLNQARKAIIQTLADNGYRNNKEIKISIDIAQGNIALANQIGQKYLSHKPKVIVAISTTSAQIAKNYAVKGNIPMVFASVTDPISSNIVKSLDDNINITGAIDFPPIKEGIELIYKLVPNVKNLGIIYNAGEANSVKSVNLLKQNAPHLNIIESTVSSSNDIKLAVLRLADKVEAIYIPSDNTVWSALTTLTSLTNKHKIPVFSSDPDSVKQGVLAAIGYTQTDVGILAGTMIADCLKKSAINNMPITTPPSYKIYLNQDTAYKIGITFPKILLNNKLTNLI